ncbi:MAG: pantetheine-phosphate adenylyltransferase [candidate division KSB1 bacterium]|nr:pantetheine-phosphate adenylyltransferase [candidate division KSB1 bacterium]MDZ7335247.1 pantetheine-phosphate adenylyltransferase [candidate division KSB1 bacterium]MDZ7358003.1 pantetheine-phosphate adenylyltransferase [candidate division KSB1 bacterium]MDZ7399784.1 pantetheine-phosphate adenylyltransferase [candidate division KSB1 bacterium]
MRIGIYPGTFDPITNGHLDIIERAVLLFDKVIVAVTTNPAKSPLFDINERIEMIKSVTHSMHTVEVDSFDDLLVNYALSKKAIAIIRGLRATSDFEYEFQMALVNRKLSDQLVTVFLMPNEKYTYLNSTIVKEIASFGGDVSRFVPMEIHRKLAEKFKKH